MLPTETRKPLDTGLGSAMDEAVPLYPTETDAEAAYKAACLPDRLRELWEAQKVWALAAGILAASQAQSELNGEPITPAELEAMRESVAQESLDMDPEPTP